MVVVVVIMLSITMILPRCFCCVGTSLGSSSLIAVLGKARLPRGGLAILVFAFYTCNIPL